MTQKNQLHEVPPPNFSATDNESRRSTVEFAVDLAAGIGFVALEAVRLSSKEILKVGRKLGRNALLGVGVAYSASHDAADLTRIVSASLKKD